MNLDNIKSDGTTHDYAKLMDSDWHEVVGLNEEYLVAKIVEGNVYFVTRDEFNDNYRALAFERRTSAFVCGECLFNERYDTLEAAWTRITLTLFVDHGTNR